MIMMWAFSPDIRSTDSKKAEQSQFHNPDEGNSDTHMKSHIINIIYIYLFWFSLAVGVGDHNFCRNPDGSEKPWCYVSEFNGVGQKEACDVTRCQGSHFHFVSNYFLDIYHLCSFNYVI